VGGAECCTQRARSMGQMTEFGSNRTSSEVRGWSRFSTAPCPSAISRWTRCGGAKRRSVDQDSLDIGGCRRTGHQHRVVRRLEPQVAIGVMQVANDGAGIEQSDKTLREICQGIHRRSCPLSQIDSPCRRRQKRRGRHRHQPNRLGRSNRVEGALPNATRNSNLLRERRHAGFGYRRRLVDHWFLATFNV
jgi:hypothetical protein